MEERINDVLENATGNKYDVYSVLCKEFISTSITPGKILEQILTHTHKIGTEDDSEPSSISKKEAKTIENNYGRLIGEIACVLMQGDPTEDDFYKKLYLEIFDSELLPQDEKHRIVYLKILIEDIKLLPYYPVTKLLKLSDEDYRDCVNRIKPSIMKAVHMINRHFDTFTEIASQLYDIEGKIEDENDRIVFISSIISMLMNQNQ